MANHLPHFRIQTLARIADWLDEQRRLFINVHLDTGVEYNYLIRSMQDLRLLVLQASRDPIFKIYRKTEFLLSGIADKDLLELALQKLPEDEVFYIVALLYYPDPCDYLVSRQVGLKALLDVLMEEWNHPVAIALINELDDDDLIRLDVLDPRTHRTTYASYDADPARYQWIIDMWRE